MNTVRWFRKANFETVSVTKEDCYLKIYSDISAETQYYYEKNTDNN